LDDLIQELYRKRYGNPVAGKIVCTSDTPEEMIPETDNGLSGWVEWKLIERRGEIDPGFEALEKELKCKLPYSFKYWHSRYYQLDADMSLIRLPAVPSNNPFKDLRREMFEMYFPEKYREQGYVPFGSDGNDTGPICFHTQAEVDDFDYPVYVLEPYTKDSMQLQFSNFRKLLEYLVHYLRGTLTDYGDLPEGYAGFKIIDPDGAGKYYDRFIR